MKVTLHAITLADADRLRDWRNQHRHFFLDDSPVTPHQHERWLKQHLKDHQQLTYIIHVDQVPVGTIGVKLGNQGVSLERVLMAETGFSRQGVMSQALQLVLQKHPSDRYYLRVRATNNPAISFYRKHGFKIKSTKKDIHFMEKKVKG